VEARASDEEAAGRWNGLPGTRKLG
jgi:hypothetical protein